MLTSLPVITACRPAHPAVPWPCTTERPPRNRVGRASACLLACFQTTGLDLTAGVRPTRPLGDQSSRSPSAVWPSVARSLGMLRGCGCSGSVTGRRPGKLAERRIFALMAGRKQRSADESFWIRLHPFLGAKQTSSSAHVLAFLVEPFPRTVARGIAAALTRAMNELGFGQIQMHAQIRVFRCTRTGNRTLFDFRGGC